MSALYRCRGVSVCNRLQWLDYGSVGDNWLQWLQGWVVLTGRRCALDRLRLGDGRGRVWFRGGQCKLDLSALLTLSQLQLDGEGVGCSFLIPRGLDILGLLIYRPELLLLLVLSNVLSLGRGGGWAGG